MFQDQSCKQEAIGITTISAVTFIAAILAGPSYYVAVLWIGFLSVCVALNVIHAFKAASVPSTYHFLRPIKELSYVQQKERLRIHPEHLLQLDNPTQEMALIAIGVDSTLINKTEHRYDPWFRKEVIRLYPKVILALRETKWANYNDWLEAVSRDWTLFQRCPKEHQNMEMCMLAAKQNEETTNYIQNYRLQQDVRKAIAVKIE